MSGSSFPQSSTRAGPRRSGWRLLGVPAALLAAVLSGCNQGPPAKKDKATRVVVTTPIRVKVVDYQDFTGRLDAFKTVEIRARVSGYIDDAPFKEGDVVHEGDLLFQIDPRPNQADLNQAKANLKLARADAKLQEKNTVRAATLLRRRAISQEDYDTIAATWEKARSTVDANVAARDRAQLYLNYTHVLSPVSGRISRRNVDPGNLVVADNTLLTTIVTEDPMYAYFDVDERTYLELPWAVAPGQPSLLAGLQAPVLMRLANEDQFTLAHTGTINFIDNRVNGNTGTIRMRGLFPNSTGALKAGLFVRIRLPIGSPYSAFLIPDEALQSDQGRKYVYVVNAQNKVVYRPVKLGQEIHGLRVIMPPEKGKEGEEGLAQGERVIIKGMQRVRPKTTVEVKWQKPPKPPEVPLVKLLAARPPAPPTEKLATGLKQLPKTDVRPRRQTPAAGKRARVK